MKSLSDQITTGVLWNTFQLLFSRGVSYIILLVLAKALHPEAFGLLGMATVFTGLAVAIGNASFTAALIQLRADEISSPGMNSARTLVFGFNILLWLLFQFAVAPLAAWFYEEPALQLIIPVLAFQGVIGSFNVIPRATLSRNMNFKAMALAESLGALIAGVIALTLAFKGAGVWSLVLQVLVLEACQIPILTRLSNDRLGWGWSAEQIKPLRRFVWFDGWNRCVLFLTKNVDYLLVGKWLGPQILGVYSLAFMATDLLRSQIMNLVNRVMFPAYGHLQDQPEEIKFYYLTVVRYNTLAIGPIMLMFVLFVDPWVPRLLGEEWSQAVFPMQAMAIASLIHAFGGTTDTVLKALGYVDLVFKLYFWKTLCITLPAFAVGISLFGIEGAAVAIVLHKLAGRILYQHFMRRIIGVQYRDLLNAATPLFMALAAALLLDRLWMELFGDARSRYVLLHLCTIVVIYAGTAGSLLHKEVRQWWLCRRQPAHADVQ